MHESRPMQRAESRRDTQSHIHSICDGLRAFRSQLSSQRFCLVCERIKTLVLARVIGQGHSVTEKPPRILFHKQDSDQSGIVETLFLELFDRHRLTFVCLRIKGRRKENVLDGAPAVRVSGGEMDLSKRAFSDATAQSVAVYGLRTADNFPGRVLIVHKTKK